MGVPSFFRWLSRKYNSIVVDAVEENKGKKIDATEPNPNYQEFDNLYIDMNGIIHPCTHPEDRPAPKTENDMFVLIFEYIDRLFSIVRPRRVLYMAIDGVAPRAKMNQQRSRRFRAAKEAVEKQEQIISVRKKLEEEGIPLPPLKPEEEHFDSNCITPGTSFMDRLSDALRYYVHKKISTDSAWQNIQIILSDASAPGEGEHKIMDFVRRQRASPLYDPNTVHCLCGADADLIMLGLATHEANFNILREEFVPNQPKACELCGQYGHDLEHCKGLAQEEAGPDQVDPLKKDKNFIFIRLPVLREYLERELEMPNLPFPYDFERAVDDWVFLCFFVGNDFLPHLPSLEIRENAIDRLIKFYKNIVYETKGWLTDSGDVIMDRVQMIMIELGKVEDEIFKQRQIKEIRYQQNVKNRQNQECNLEEGFSYMSQSIPNRSLNNYNEERNSNKSMLHLSNNFDPLNEAFIPCKATTNKPMTKVKSIYNKYDTSSNLNNKQPSLNIFQQQRNFYGNAKNDLNEETNDKIFTRAEDLNVKNKINLKEKETKDISVISAMASKTTNECTDSVSDAKNKNFETNVRSSELDTNISKDRVLNRLFSISEQTNLITQHTSIHKYPSNLETRKRSAQDHIQIQKCVEVSERLKALLIPHESKIQVVLNDPLEQKESPLKMFENKQFNDLANKEVKNEEKEENHDNVRFYEKGWKDRYYRAKFNVSEGDVEFRRKVARAYAEGLCWVLKYYYQGCASWTWYYPYHYAPFASDFDTIADFKPDFSKPTRPVKPLEQLMGVFPAASRALIPESWRSLMTDENSPIYDFYPSDFKIDLNGKKFAWQGVALLPFVDQQRLLNALADVYSTLTPEEIRRNCKGLDRLFVSKNHSAFSLLYEVYSTGKAENFEKKKDENGEDIHEWVALNPDLTNKMVGEISWDKENIEIGDFYPSILSNSLEWNDIKSNSCIMVFYREPQFIHGHRFLANRLDGIEELEKVLKPGDWDNKRNGQFRPQLGFTRNVPRANLSSVGHRFLNHAIQQQQKHQQQVSPFMSHEDSNYQQRNYNYYHQNNNLNNNNYNQNNHYGYNQHYQTQSNRMYNSGLKQNNYQHQNNYQPYPPNRYNQNPSYYHHQTQNYNYNSNNNSNNNRNYSNRYNTNNARKPNYYENYKK